MYLLVFFPFINCYIILVFFLSLVKTLCFSFFGLCCCCCCCFGTTYLGKGRRKSIYSLFQEISTICVYSKGGGQVYKRTREGIKYLPPLEVKWFSNVKMQMNLLGKFKKYHITRLSLRDSDSITVGSGPETEFLTSSNT